MSSSDNSSFTTQNYDPNFDTQNFTITIPNLAEANYTFSFTDGNGCTEEEIIQVKKPEEIENDLIVAESVTALDCNGDSDGKLTFVASGGWTEPWNGNTVNPNGWGNPYIFKLMKNSTEYSSGEVVNSVDSNGNQNGYKTSFTGLSAGTYTLTVTENIATNPYDSSIVYKCSKTFTETFTITEPDELIASGTATNIDCNGNDNGSIDLSVAGGTANYTYAWTKTGDNSYSANTKDLSDLSPGTYNVTVTDANDCTDTASFTITEPDELFITDAGLSTEIACFGDNGQIRVNITQESVANYTYALYQEGSVVQTITNNNLNHTFSAPAGTYKVRVTDANGCFKETSDITLTQPNAELSASASITNVSCNAGNDGSIDITVSGGTTGYSYSWTGPNSFTSNQLSINNLSSGIYTLTVTDANDCSLSRQVEITEPDELIASGTATNIDCNGNDNGSIDLSVAGGTANYTYSWTKTGDNSYSATTQDLSDLSPGTYNVTVTDANDCTDTASFTITEPDELFITDAGLSTEIACFGDNGQIRVNITQESVANYTYALYQEGSVVQTITNNNLNHTFSAPAGTYKVRVTDANGCFKETSDITLTQPDSGLTIVDETVNNIDCNGNDNGSISITTTGGTANYVFQWIKIGNGNYSATSEDISDLSPGVYAVTITDEWMYNK